MQGAWTSLLWFFAVIALIPLALWLLKRTPLGGAGLGLPAGGSARTVGVLALSASQRVVTVEVGQGDDRRWLVLGVTPGSISTLHTLPPQGAAPGSEGVSATTPAASFAALLGKFKQPPGRQP